MTMDFMSVSSYSGSESSGFVRINSDHKTNISGWDVILIDDIVNSGYTITTVVPPAPGPQAPKPESVCLAG